MTYIQAKKELDNNVNNVPDYVSLFIAPKDKQSSGEENLKSYIGEIKNKAALEKFGYIDNDDLDVYATYQDGNQIVYPTLSCYLQMLAKLNDQ